MSFLALLSPSERLVCGVEEWMLGAPCQSSEIEDRSRPEADVGDLLRICSAGLPRMTGLRRATWALLWLVPATADIRDGLLLSSGSHDALRPGHIPVETGSGAPVG